MTDPLRDAVANLLKVKGRHNTEHAYKRLQEAYEAAQLAAPADLLRRLLADHQRVEPHHADMCQLCREVAAAIDGQPVQSNSHQIAVKQPAQGERHKIPCACYEGTVCATPAWCNQSGCKVAQGERRPSFSVTYTSAGKVFSKDPADGDR